MQLVASCAGVSLVLLLLLLMTTSLVSFLFRMQDNVHPSLQQNHQCIL
uniref:Uncharacterized protein n=1 Tax=Rhizophora mucronata TaxID=61149 RepID=A0A2P2QMW2_RHIMU